MVSTRPVGLTTQAFKPVSSNTSQQAPSLASAVRKSTKRIPKPQRPSVLNLPNLKRSEPPEVFLTGLKAVFPPIVSPIYHNPTPAFLWHLIDALLKVPVRLRKAVSDWGYTIIAAPNIFTPQHLSHPNPAMFLHQFIPGTLLHKIQDDLRVSSWWKTLTSASKFSPKTILMPETGWQCRGMVAVGSMLLPISLHRYQDWMFKVDHFGFVPAPAERPGLIMLHELGHAVDDFLGGSFPDGCHFFLSHSEAFRQAYQNDIARITDKKTRQALSYYLPRAEDPRDWNGRAKGEAFAQVFALLRVPNYGNPDLRDQDARFLSYFPRVASFIRNNVFKPWRWKPRPGSQGSASSHNRQQKPQKEAPSHSP